MTKYGTIRMIRSMIVAVMAVAVVSVAAYGQTSYKDRATISADRKAAQTPEEKDFLSTERQIPSAQTVEEPSVIEKTGPYVAAEQKQPASEAAPTTYVDKHSAIPSMVAGPGESGFADVPFEKQAEPAAEKKLEGEALYEDTELAEKTKIEVSDAVIDRELPSLRVNLKDIIRNAEQNIKKVDEQLKAEEEGKAKKLAAQAPAVATGPKASPQAEQLQRMQERARKQAECDAREASRKAQLEAQKRQCEIERQRCESERRAQIAAEKRRREIERQQREKERARRDAERRQKIEAQKRQREIARQQRIAAREAEKRRCELERQKRALECARKSGGDSKVGYRSTKNAPQAPQPTASVECAALYKEGIALYLDGRYREAQAAFDRIGQLSPHYVRTDEYLRKLREKRASGQY